MPSASDLNRLPVPELVESAFRAAAVLEIILNEAESTRCHSFDPRWSKNVRFAKYENGGGDDMRLLFLRDSCVIKGFAHESNVSPYQNDDHSSWPGMFDGIPDRLMKELKDPAIVCEDVTFCVWYSEGEWQCGSVEFEAGEDDGASWLLQMIPSSPESFVRWAAEYYEQDIDMRSVRAVFAGEEVTADLIEVLNPERKAKAAIQEIGSLAENL